MKKFHKQLGFTIVELLITMFLFSAVVAIGLTSVTTSLLSGNLKSEETKQANLELNNIMQTITQKMANANSVQTLKDGSKVYGFKDVDANTLAIASKDQCTLIGKKDDGLYMKQDACNNIPATFTDTEKISSSAIKITDFSFPDIKEGTSPTDTFAPYLTIKLQSANLKDPTATATMQSSYGIKL